MRWKGYFYFNPGVSDKWKQTFGFTSRNTTPPIPAMLNFEKRLLTIIQNITFRKVKCPLQRKLSSDIQCNITNSNDLLVPADKTSNFYRMVSNTYNSLLQKNINKTYKKVKPNTMNSIELEAQKIVNKLHLEDRVYYSQMRSLQNP